MNEYKVVHKTYVKSNNSVKKIYLNYTYSLIIFIALTIVSYLMFNHRELILPLIKSLAISLVITSVIGYIINLINKETNIKKIYVEDNLHIIAIVLGLLGINTNIIILTIAIIVTLIFKRVIKNFELSSVLYGALIIVLYKYYTSELSLSNISTITYENLVTLPIKDYLIGAIYLSPIISVLAFLYLFYKKSIKYNIYVSYVLTFAFIMFIYGIFNNILWFPCFTLATENIMFLAVYALPDYKATPTIKETSIIYGIILGIITSILRFIIPELSIILPMILGLLLTKPLDNLSAKLKYNKKLYNSIIIISMVLIILTSVVLTIVF